MGDEQILVQRQESIATVSLNRPERGNALTTAMLKRLEEVAGSFRDDGDTRVVIVRGEGDHFSFGADLDASNIANSGDVPLVVKRRSLELGARLMRALREIHQPTICAIQGVATGGGACIASACDFRVGTKECRIGYGEVKLGINLMWNALPLCVQLVGPARAKQMIMTGNLFDGTTMAHWGFLDRCVSTAELNDHVFAWAHELAALPPIAVQMIKRSVNAVSGALDASIMHMDSDQWIVTSQTADFAEGVSSFIEKRSPTFKGQ